MNEDTCTNFWGDKDTSISFCEAKYDKVLWIAEYYNTLSSFSYITFPSGPFLLEIPATSPSQRGTGSISRPARAYSTL